MKVLSAFFILMIPSTYQVYGMNRVVPDSGDNKTVFIFDCEKKRITKQSLPKNHSSLTSIGTFPMISITDKALSIDGKSGCFSCKTPPFIKAITSVAKGQKKLSAWITHSFSANEEEEEEFEVRAEQSILAMKGKIRTLKITSQHKNFQDFRARENDLKKPFGTLLRKLQKKGALTNLHSLILEACDSVSTEDLFTFLSSDQSKIKTLQVKNMYDLSPFTLFKNGLFSLENIKFEQISMTEGDVKQIFEAEGPSTLKCLEFDMDGSNFPDLWDRVTKSEKFNTLTHLTIKEAQVTDKSFATVYNNFDLKSLAYLDLSNNKISSITDIATALPQLKELNLSNNSVDLYALTEFVQHSTSSQNLKNVILAGCNIDQLEMEELINMIEEKGLTIIW